MTAYNGHQATKQVTEQVVGGGADWGSRHLNGFELDCKPPVDGRLLPLQMRRRTGALDPAQPRSARLGGGDDSGKGGEGQHWAGRSSPVRSSLGAPRKAPEAPATPIPPMGTMNPLSGPRRGVGQPQSSPTAFQETMNFPQRALSPDWQGFVRNCNPTPGASASCLVRSRTGPGPAAPPPAPPPPPKRRWGRGPGTSSSGGASSSSWTS